MPSVHAVFERWTLKGCTRILHAHPEALPLVVFVSAVSFLSKVVHIFRKVFIVENEGTPPGS